MPIWYLQVYIQSFKFRDTVYIFYEIYNLKINFNIFITIYKYNYLPITYKY